jgi:DNA-binding CsgD family transcriptional regulator/tetratricopeptide (TPR) repeat protein
MRLLERAGALASLVEHADEAGQGDGRLVLIGGEAGVGKSALVERFQRDLPDARWMWGVCDGLFTPQPLAPLFDLADQIGGSLLDLCRSGVGREELFRAVLREVSGPELDVVVIEDVHWADEATLDLLRFLVRRLRNASALIIATFRDDVLSVGDSLQVALGDLATQPSSRRLDLVPLSVDGVRALAEGSGLEASALYTLTGGNPFFLTQVLRAGLETVPATARDAVLARAARLGDEARDALTTAALFGGRVQVRLLQSITACSSSTVDELLTCGLLAGHGAWLGFRHEIARLAVEGAVASHRRGVVHRGIFDALRSSGCDDDARMAFHAEAAGDGPAVVRHAYAAAQQAVRMASHREAAAQFERAMRFAADADTLTVARLNDGLADVLPLMGRQQDAADAAGRALALWLEVGDLRRQGDTLRRLSTIMWNLRQGMQATASAEEAVSVLEPLGPTIELAWAYAACAGLRMSQGENDVAIRLASRAQQIAEPLGALDVLSDALNTQAVCAAMRGQDWIELMERALKIALSEGFHKQAARAYANLSCLFDDAWEFDEGERYTAAGIAYCDEHDLVEYATCLRSAQAWALERTGRWDESLALSAELATQAVSSPGTRLASITRIGLIKARRDETDAWKYLDEAVMAADTSGEPQSMVGVRLARAEAFWLEGKLDDAMREAERADAVADNWAWNRGAVAVWLARTGSRLSRQDDLAGPYRPQVEGDWDEAARRWNELRCPYEAALALTAASEESALCQAFEIFIRLGAFPAARTVRDRLRLLGMRSLPAEPQASTRAHPFGLTRREHEVLVLICAEHTNAKIAEKLCISIKTVEQHVTSILAKMGVPNRNSAASRAVQLGLTHRPATRTSGMDRHGDLGD